MPSTKAAASPPGEPLRERRLQLRESQPRNAEHLETPMESRSTLDWGARLPSLWTLVAASKALGSSLDSVVGADPERDDDALVVAARGVS